METSYISGSAVPEPRISKNDSPQAKLEWFKSYFRPHFEKVILQPIHDLVISDNALIGFLLMACAIDYLAGYLRGGGKNVKEAYTGFIERYMPQYQSNSEKIYDGLRNGLIHMFTIKGKLIELTKNQSKFHGKPNGHEQIILNAEDFEKEVSTAAKKFFDDVEDIENNPELIDKVVRRYIDFPLIDFDVNKFSRIQKLN